jgi:predicted alpha/beta-fold hydrolase
LNSHYKRPSILFNGHIETIYPALLRKVRNVPDRTRQRIATPDGDFLDLDWIKNNHNRLVILQHGLEGSSDRAYILGMAKIFSNHRYDVCAWNFRGCSGEMNKTPLFYHSGATYDLDLVVKEGLKNYDDITLVGFSLGGNLTLKYLGEEKRDPRVKRGVAISVPLDLATGADNLDTPKCVLYQKRFLRNLREKVISKESIIPGSMNIKNLGKATSIRTFDEYFTAPIHGFDGADDYYRKNSSIFFLDGISVPTLILNASNDPLLTPPTLNPQLASKFKFIDYKITDQGGHVGFTEFNKEGYYWSEKKALNFCDSH